MEEEGDDETDGRRHPDDRTTLFVGVAQYFDGDAGEDRSDDEGARRGDAESHDLEKGHTKLFGCRKQNRGGYDSGPIFSSFEFDTRPMPPRRKVLLSIVANVPIGFAGCLSSSATGYVQFKGVVGLEDDGSRDSVIRVAFAPDQTTGDIVYLLADRWADDIDDTKQPTVSESLDQELRQYYDGIRYLVGVCSERWAGPFVESRGCYNTECDREDFNQAQVYDRVVASRSESSIEIHDVTGTKTFTPGQ